MPALTSSLLPRPSLSPRLSSPQPTLTTPAPAFAGHRLPRPRDDRAFVCGSQLAGEPRGPEAEDLITGMPQCSRPRPIMDNYLQHVKTQPPAKLLHLTHIFVPL